MKIKLLFSPLAWSIKDLDLYLKDEDFPGEPRLVFSYHYHYEEWPSSPCFMEYLRMAHEMNKRSYRDFLTVKCPSEACSHLKTKSFLSLDLYDENGDHYAKLTDGLQYEQYMEYFKGFESRFKNLAWDDHQREPESTSTEGNVHKELEQQAIPDADPDYPEYDEESRSYEY